MKKCFRIGCEKRLRGDGGRLARKVSEGDDGGGGYAEGICGRGMGCIDVHNVTVYQVWASYPW